MDPGVDFSFSVSANVLLLVSPSASMDREGTCPGSEIDLVRAGKFWSLDEGDIGASRTKKVLEV